MPDTTILSRFQFGFTLAYHYLFPQFTMGLALLLVILKGLYLRTGQDIYNRATYFWGHILAITFVLGVVTGIPMEFQFGTNWSRFSAETGDIIAQTLAMEGAFAFFLESAFLGLFLFGERLIGQKLHFVATVLVWLGTWASGAFIVTTNAWMQHPVGYSVAPGGRLTLTDYWAVLTNPWVYPEYAHVMTGSVITASFLMAGLGAFYILSNRHVDFGRIFVTIGVMVGILASIIQLYPTGDAEGRQVADVQPAKLAAIEGVFRTQAGAGIVILGQPNPTNGTLDNAIIVPNVLSFLTYRRWTAVVRGLLTFPADQRPSAIETTLSYYTYHIMVGLGTIFIAIMGLALLLLWRRRLFTTRWMLWILFLAMPFPFIANTAGWFTTEVGRQPWIAFGLMRTTDGSSPLVSSGSILFTLLGFAGIYLMLGLLYILLVVGEALRGPTEPGPEIKVEAAQDYLD